MAYEIRTIRNMSELETGNPAKIDVYNWGGDYRPVSEAKLCFLPGEGFAVRLCSREKNPRAVQTVPDSQVCEDSCLEFFCDFAPDRPECGYVNFEGNAAGIMLCHFGLPGHRVPVAQLGCGRPNPRAFRGDDFWGWELMIPLDFLRRLYGDAEFGTGSVLRGGFFKCGDKTEHPHFGSWQKIDWPEPSFHRPQFFGEMRIVG